MRCATSLLAIAAAVVLLGCDAFLPSSGYYDQPCRSDGTCAEGLACQNDVCVRVARTWFVHPNPTAQDEDGESWLTAATQLQDVMDKAAAGDQIWVAAGTYGRRSLSDETLLEMKPGVEVYGGFEGGETRREQRDVVNRKPILDCASHCSRVVIAANQSVLDGFIVRGATIMDIEELADGTGLYAADVGGLEVRNCIFIANNGHYGAGATIEHPVGPVEFSDCLFESNLASRSGGGLYVTACEGGQVSLNRVEFRANRGVESGGAATVAAGCELELSNGIVWDNLAADGAGVYADGALWAVNSTFADNEAATSGGAIYNGSSGSILINSIFYGDSAASGGDEIYFANGDASIVSHCLVDGGLAGGTQIIDADPRFVSRVGGNFRLQAGSPCINAGLNDHVDLIIPAVDFDGRSRPQDGLVDMGAFEY